MNVDGELLSKVVDSLMIQSCTSTHLILGIKI